MTEHRDKYVCLQFQVKHSREAVIFLRMSEAWSPPFHRNRIMFSGLSSQPNLKKQKNFHIPVSLVDVFVKTYQKWESILKGSQKS